MARDDETNDRAETDAWEQIVANYGERPALEPDEAAAEPAAGPAGEPEPEQPEWFHPEEESEGFVPPAPPPIPRPSTDRLIAWLGVLGVPVLVLVAIVLGIDLPAWAGLLLAAAFVGGFVYLVAKLPRTPTDPWDDGARL